MRYDKDYICLDSMRMINVQKASIARIPPAKSPNAKRRVTGKVRQSVNRCLTANIRYTGLSSRQFNTYDNANCY